MATTTRNKNKGDVVAPQKLNFDIVPLNEKVRYNVTVRSTSFPAFLKKWLKNVDPDTNSDEYIEDFEKLKGKTQACITDNMTSKGYNIAHLYQLPLYELEMIIDDLRLPFKIVLDKPIVRTPLPSPPVLHLPVPTNDKVVSVRLPSSATSSDTEDIVYDSLEDLVIEQPPVPSKVELIEEEREFRRAVIAAKPKVQKSTTKRKTKKVKLQRFDLPRSHAPYWNTSKYIEESYALNVSPRFERAWKKTEGIPLVVQNHTKLQQLCHHVTLEESLNVYYLLKHFKNAGEGTFGDISKFDLDKKHHIKNSLFKFSDIDPLEEYQLRENAHVSHNPHHTNSHNQMMSVKDTIELLCDQTACALRYCDILQDAVTMQFEWIFEEKDRFLNVKPKYINLNPAGVIAFAREIFNQGFTTQNLGFFKRATLQRKKHFLTLKEYHELKDFRLFCKRIRLDPVLSYYYLETINHVNLVNRLLSYFRIAQKHDADKFHHDMLLTYAMKWFNGEMHIDTNGEVPEFPSTAKTPLETIKDTIEAARDTPRSVFTDIYSFMEEKTTEIKTGLMASFEETLNPVVEFFNSIKEMLVSAVTSITPFLDEVKKIFQLKEDLGVSPAEVVKILLLIVIYNSSSNTIIRTLIITAILNTLGLLSIITNAFKLVYDEIKGKMSLFSTIDTGLTDDFSLDTILSLDNLYENSEALGILGGILFTAITSTAISYDKMRPLGTNISNAIRNAGFMGTAFLGGSRIISLFVPLIKTTLECVREHFAPNIKFPSEEVKRKKEALYKEIITWSTRVEALNNEEGYRLIKTNKEIATWVREKYPSAIRFGKMAYKDDLPRPLQIAIPRAVEAHKKLFNIVDRMLTYGNFRLTPFHMQLVGQAGVGKSTLVQRIVQEFCETYCPETPEESRMYARGNTDHYDGYANQPVFYWDDMWSVADANKITECLSLISNTPLPLPMAHLEDKSTYFNSKFFISTTNTPWPAVKDVLCSTAVWRRRHLLVEVVMDERVRNSSSHKFDMDLFKKHFADHSTIPMKELLQIWPHLRFNLLKPVPNDGRPPRSNNRSHLGMYSGGYYEESDILPTGITLPCTDLSIEDLLELMKKRYNALRAEERAVRNDPEKRTTIMKNLWTEADFVTETLAEDEYISTEFAERILEFDETATEIINEPEEEQQTLDDLNIVFKDMFEEIFADTADTSDIVNPTDVLEMEARRRQRILRKRGVADPSEDPANTAHRNFGSAKLIMHDEQIYSFMTKNLGMTIIDNVNNVFGEPTEVILTEENAREYLANLHRFYSPDKRMPTSYFPIENYKNHPVLGRIARRDIAPKISLWFLYRTKFLEEPGTDLKQPTINAPPGFYYNVNYEVLRHRKGIRTRGNHFYYNDTVFKTVARSTGIESLLFEPWFIEDHRQFFALRQEERLALLQENERLNKIVSYTSSYFKNLKERISKLSQSLWDQTMCTFRYLWIEYMQPLVKPLLLVASAFGVIAVIRKISKLFQPHKSEDTSRFLFKRSNGPRIHKDTNGETSNEEIQKSLLSIRKNQLYIQTETGSCGNAIGFDGHYLLTCYHMFRREIDQKIRFKIFFNPNSKCPLWSGYVEPHNVYVIPDADAVVFRIDNLPMFKTISHKFLSDDDYLKYEIPRIIINPHYQAPENFMTPISETKELLHNYKYQSCKFPETKTLGKCLSYKGHALKGSSGSPVLGPRQLIKPFILGLQSNTDTYFDASYVTIVTKNDLDKAMATLGITTVHQGPLICNENKISATSELLINVDTCGTVPMNCVVGRVKKSSFIKTPISTFFHSERIPAILDPFDDRVPEDTHPLQHSINKFGRDVIEPLDPDQLRHAQQGVCEYLKGKLTGLDKIQPLDILSSLTGLREIGYESVNLATSMGLPWILDKFPGKLPGKREYFEYSVLDGHVTRLSHEFELEFQEFDAKLRQGIIPKNSLYVFPKDELRPIAKVIGPPIKTRSIDVMNFTLTLLWRKYMLPVEAALHKAANGSTQCCVGINPSSVHWSNLYHSLKSVNDVGFDADVGNWDGHFPPDLFHATTDVLCELSNYPINSPEWLAVRGLADNALFGFEQFEDIVVGKERGMPSGFGGTAIINTVGHMILFYYMYRTICIEHNLKSLLSFELYLQHICVRFYGDDVIATVSQTLLDKDINALTFVDKYEELGWPTTVASKTGVPQPFKPLEECTFLKRVFTFDPILRSSVVYGALDTGVIEDLCYWMRKTVAIQSQFYSNLNDALEFACCHGSQYYDNLLFRINKALKQYNYNIILINYSDMREILLDRYYN